MRHLLLHHPSAGLQLVKGTVEPGEDPTRAAARELFEEAGLETVAATPMGASETIQPGEVWHFALCRVRPPVRDNWQHLAPDDGGTLFRFSWLELDADHTEMEARYSRALKWIQNALI